MLIKLEIDEPRQFSPDAGHLAVLVELSPSCSIYADDRYLQSYSTLVADRLQWCVISVSLKMHDFLLTNYFDRLQCANGIEFLGYEAILHSQGEILLGCACGYTCKCCYCC